MNYIVIASILMLIVLTSCETEKPVSHEISSMEDRTKDIIENEVMDIEDGAVVVAEQPDEPIDFIDRIVEHVFVDRRCYVGREFTIEGTLLKPGGVPLFGFGPLRLDTNHKRIASYVIDLEPLRDNLSCENYFKAGEKYILPIRIKSITAPINNKLLDIGEKPRPLFFNVYARIVVTEELKLQLMAAGCWKEKN